MNEAELLALLARPGLERYSSALRALASPCIRIFIEQADDSSLRAGASRLGGRPDLPPDMDWPAWHVPMAFIAQFNLSELAPFDTEHALPTNGLLSFFAETAGEPLLSEELEFGADFLSVDRRDFDASPGWRVLHLTGDPTAFTRRDFPPRVPMQLPACTASFATELTLPELEEPEFPDLNPSPVEWNLLVDALNDPLNSVNRGRFEDGGHHLLGYACNLASSGRAIAAARTDGRPGAADPEAVRRWRLLLQLDSSTVAQMDWAGGGMLQWYIDSDCLQARDFSRVQATFAFL
jgi:hypothetical protein